MILTKEHIQVLYDAMDEYEQRTDITRRQWDAAADIFCVIAAAMRNNSEVSLFVK